MWPFLIVQKERRAGDGTTRNRSLRARRSLLPDGIGEPCDAKSLAQQAIDGLGTIYILVNNAAFQRTYEQAQLAPSLSSWLASKQLYQGRNSRAIDGLLVIFLVTRLEQLKTDLGPIGFK